MDAEAIRLTGLSTHEYGKLLLRFGVAGRVSGVVVGLGASTNAKVLKRRLEILKYSNLLSRRATSACLVAAGIPRRSRSCPYGLSRSNRGRSPRCQVGFREEPRPIMQPVQQLELVPARQSRATKRLCGWLKPASQIFPSGPWMPMGNHPELRRRRPHHRPQRCPTLRRRTIASAPVPPLPPAPPAPRPIPAPAAVPYPPMPPAVRHRAPDTTDSDFAAELNALISENVPWPDLSDADSARARFTKKQREQIRDAIKDAMRQYRADSLNNNQELRKEAIRQAMEEA